MATLDSSRADDPSESEVLWDVVEEHLDEAEFAFERWTHALESPQLTLFELAATHEARLLAQLDALLEAGPDAPERLLAPVFATDGAPPSRVTAAGLCLLSLQRRDLVEGALTNGGLASAGAERALVLGATPDFDDWTVRALSERPDPAVRSPLLRIAAARGLRIPNLLVSLQSDNPEELAAAACAAVWSDAERHLPVLEYLIDYPDVDVANAALIASVTLGSHFWSQRCEVRLAASTDLAALPMLLLALLGDVRHHGSVIEQLARPSHREAALVALGFSGQAALVPVLLEHLRSDEPRVQKLAAEAIGLLTGLDPNDDAHVLDEQEPGSDELPELDEDLSRALTTSGSDELPVPNAVAIEEWCHTNAARLGVKRRLLLGEPWTVKSSLDALARLPMRKRHRIALWLQLRSGGTARVDTCAFASVQRRQIMALGSLDDCALMRRFSSW
jgi:uncharacterized protein (TIGR02270 family)